MPLGQRGFQRGRQKTGGRTKSSGLSARKSSRFVDQLKDSGFNYHKALADALKALPAAALDPVAYKTWLANYAELKALLPYMAPKLLEKEVEVGDFPEEGEGAVGEGPSTEDILAALNNGKPETKANPRPSDPPPVAAGSPVVPLSGSAEVDLRDLAGEPQEE